MYISVHRTDIFVEIELIEEQLTPVNSIRKHKVCR